MEHLLRPAPALALVDDHQMPRLGRAKRAMYGHRRNAERADRPGADRQGALRRLLQSRSVGTDEGARCVGAAGLRAVPVHAVLLLADRARRRARHHPPHPRPGPRPARLESAGRRLPLRQVHPRGRIGRTTERRVTARAASSPASSPARAPAIPTPAARGSTFRRWTRRGRSTSSTRCVRSPTPTARRSRRWRCVAARQGRVTSVIIGAKRMDQLVDNLGAVDLALTRDELNGSTKRARRPRPTPPGGCRSATTVGPARRATWRRS